MNGQQHFNSLHNNLRMIIAAYAALVLPSGAMKPETDPTDAETPTEAEAPSTPQPTTTTRAAPRACVTPRAVTGMCSPRHECDYSTGPVDHSLFKPSWYISGCLEGEVCCPIASLIPATPKTGDQPDESFDDDNF